MSPTKSKTGCTTRTIRFMLVSKIRIFEQMLSFRHGGHLGPSSYAKVDNWYHQVFSEWTTRTMPFSAWVDNWDHAIFDIGGQLGPFSYVKVDNWYHQVFPEWSTGTMPFSAWVDNWDHLLYYSYTGTISV